MPLQGRGRSLDASVVRTFSAVRMDRTEAGSWTSVWLRLPAANPPEPLQQADQSLAIDRVEQRSRRPSASREGRDGRDRIVYTVRSEECLMKKKDNEIVLPHTVESSQNHHSFLSYLLVVGTL